MKYISICAATVAFAVMTATSALADKPIESSTTATTPAPTPPIKCKPPKVPVLVKNKVTEHWVCRLPKGPTPDSNGFNGRELNGLRHDVLNEATFDASTISVKANR